MKAAGLGRVWTLVVVAGCLVPARTTQAGLPPIDLGKGFELGVSGQVRPRAVAHSGLDLLEGGVEARHHIDHRIRLGVQLSHESGVMAKVVLQDVRTWGEEDAKALPTLNDFGAAGLDLQEAYARIPLVDRLSLLLGRQEINLGNHRLVGNVGWSQRARSFDAARLVYESPKGPAHGQLFYARVREADASAPVHVSDLDGHVPADRKNQEVHLIALHGGWAYDKLLKASFTYLANFDDVKNDKRQTAGIQANGAMSLLDYSAEFYYQFGRTGGEDVGAFMAAASVGAKFDVPTKPGILLRGEFLSGDGKATGVFETPYPTNHKFYGELDYFLAIGKNTARLGLIDAGGRLTFNLWPKKLKFYADAHLLMAAEPDAAGNSDFGTEIDAKVIVTVIPHVAFRAFYGVFLPGAAMRTARGYGAEQSLKTEHLFYFTTDVKF